MNFKTVLSGLAVGLAAGGLLGADAPAPKKAAAPAPKKAVAKAKNWTPAGELQVASSKLLLPQVGELAKMANFTLLPMIVQQALSSSQPAMEFGAPDETSDIGCKLFIKGDEIGSVLMWPLSKGGADAWKKANPGKTVKGSAFSGDGKWVFFSENEALAKLAVTKGSPIERPLKKGLVRLTLEGREFFDSLEPMIRKNVEEFEKASGAQMEDSELLFGTLGSIFSDLNSIRATLGLSKAGIDLRLKAIPREDGGIVKPRAMEEWEVTYAKTNGWDALPFYGYKNVKKDAERKALEDDLAKVIPESAKAAEPLFALRHIGELSENKGEASFKVWIFCWFENSAYRLILRLPSDSLAKAFAAMVQVGMSEEGADPSEVPPTSIPQAPKQPAPPKGGAK